MRILYRHINYYILHSVMIVFFVLLGIQSFVVFAEQLKDIGKGNFDLLHVMLMVPLMLPSEVYQFFPIAALLGSVVGLGRLASASELIVMRASGLSIWQVLYAVLQSAVILTLLILLPGEMLAPKARDIALNFKTNAITKGQMLTTTSGTWVRDGNHFLHINKVIGPTIWYGIMHYKFGENNQLQLASVAKRGEYKGHYWIFYDVNQTQFLAGRTKSTHFDQQNTHLNINPKLLHLSELDPGQQSLKKLYRYIEFRKASGLGVGDYAFAFWQRLFQPFTTIVMILLAIPFVFGPLRSVAMGKRIVAGVMVGVSFYLLNRFFSPLSMVYQIPPFVAAALPILAFAMLGTLMIIYKR